MGRKKPWSDLVKILLRRDVLEVITCAKFGVDRLRGFSVARGQILGFFIGFQRRPYNSLALPCECAMSVCSVNKEDLSNYRLVSNLSFLHFDFLPIDFLPFDFSAI